MRKADRKTWTLFVLSGLILSGCAEFRPIAVSTSRLDPEKETVLGVVEGKAINDYFLAFQFNEEEGMLVAVNRAKSKVGADNLVNVFVDQRVTHYPFTLLPIFTRVETMVRGTAVRYKDRSLTQIKDLTVPESSPNQTAPTPAPVQKPAESVF